MTASVTNGVFAVPTLETVRGRFVARFIARGELKRTHVFTKDASSDFVGFPRLLLEEPVGVPSRAIS